MGQELVELVHVNQPIILTYAVTLSSNVIIVNVDHSELSSVFMWDYFMFKNP